MAAAVILCHNHPSGNCIPSSEDIETTHRMVEAGECLGIQVLDHLIISTKGYFSIKEEGLLEPVGEEEESILQPLSILGVS